VNTHSYLMLGYRADGTPRRPPARPRTASCPKQQSGRHLFA
jgi:hypothetical protein